MSQQTEQLSRAQQLRLIYRHTFRDYKGRTNGVQSILVNRGATCLVPLEQLTDAEIADRLPYAMKKEAERIEAKSASKGKGGAA